MSYTKTTWKTGDTITANGLNKIENGIEETSNSFGVIPRTNGWYFLNVNDSSPEWAGKPDLIEAGVTEDDEYLMTNSDYLLVLKNTGELQKINVLNLKFFMVGES